MPIKKAALKRMRADKKRRAKNARILNDLKTRVRHIRGLIAEKKADETRSALSLIVSKLDKAAQKKVIHRNKASRTISRLKKAVGRLGAA